MKKFQRLIRCSHKEDQQKKIYELEQELEYYKNTIEDLQEHNAELGYDNRCMSDALKVFGDPSHWKEEYNGKFYWKEFSEHDFDDPYNQPDHFWTPINFAREMNCGLVRIDCGRESPTVGYDDLDAGPFCPDCLNVDLWNI